MLTQPCRRKEGLRLRYIALENPSECCAESMPAQPLRAAEAAASSLLAAVEAHSPDAVNQIRQHLVPAVAHFSVRPSLLPMQCAYE